MKVAQTVTIKAGQEIEQAWILKPPYWQEVNRLPDSSKDEAFRYLTGKERTSVLFERAHSATIWTID